MITIRDIIALAAKYNLQNAKFIAGDAANASIEIRNGVAWFKQPTGNDEPLSTLSSDEVDRIDGENNYYIKEVWDQLRALIEKNDAAIPFGLEDTLLKLNEEADKISRESQRVSREMFTAIQPYLTNLPNCNKILSLVNDPWIKREIRGVKQALAFKVVADLENKKV